MDQTELLNRVKRDIGQTGAVTVGTTQLSLELTNAIQVFALAIEEADPDMLAVRKALLSDHNYFTKPSDLRRLVNCFDYAGTALQVEDASNTTPIVLEITSHGLADDDVVIVHDILGNTAGNGKWKITVQDDDNIELNSSVGNAAYTSGGVCFLDKRHMAKIYGIGNATLQTRSHRYGYILQGNEIVVDYKGFTNSIVIDYIKMSSDLSDIPVEFHTGISAQMVVWLMDFSVAHGDPVRLKQLENSLQRNQRELDKALSDIKTLGQDGAPKRQTDEVDWDSLYVQ